MALLVLVGKATHAELAENFLRTVPKIMAFVGKHSPPFIAKVHRASPAQLAHNPHAPGSMSLWYPKSHE